MSKDEYGYAASHAVRVHVQWWESIWWGWEFYVALSLAWCTFFFALNVL